MTEPAIAAAPIVEAAAKALAPEAEQLLNELHDVAIAAAARIDQIVPELLAKAQNESAIALRGAQQHLAALLDHVASALHLTTPASSSVDPTSAVPAPQP